MSDPVILIHTVEGLDAIINNGGSGYWHASRWRWKEFQYVCLCQNLLKAQAEAVAWAFATGKHPHNSAFLVGRLKDLVEWEDNEDEAWRGIFKFSEYALIDPLPNVWPGLRHPLYYGTTLQEIGIDPASLSWQPMPPTPAREPRAEPAKVAVNKPVPPTGVLADVTQFAAERLGVSPEVVEITITLRRPAVMAEAATKVA
ncbi:MAG: hypothetical protein HIU82_14175 [Proteobacteria bacterium]|nr:hypothetical protein [Pseudomonadota bacterium]